MSGAWSDKEVKIIVADYFAMLEAEIRREQYNKTAHRRSITEQLNNRTDGSIVFPARRSFR